MKVLILGIDGYLGWSLAIHLLSHGGYSISGIDDCRRRRWVEEVGSHSAIPIKEINDRLITAHRVFDKDIYFRKGDLQDCRYVDLAMQVIKPHTIIHFAEMPSAPYSMRSNEHALRSQWNNISTTINVLYAMKKHCPEAHLVKLGSMGEYGTPNIPIQEGFLEVELSGRKDTLPFPKKPGSWYHLSKVHDSHNIMFACNIWGLRSTDVMQGVVYGTRVDGMDYPGLATRFDFDGDFGTVINRFVSQAIVGHSVTPYGIGNQKRGFLPLRDSMQCLKLAIDNPPYELGEYRVFNQFEEVYSINSLAKTVMEVAEDFGLGLNTCNIENPRVELEDHFYEPVHNNLLELGYVPNHNMKEVLREMFTDLLPYKERIKEKEHVLLPDVSWITGVNKEK